MRDKKIPTILGVIFLVVGVAAGVLLVQQRQIFRLGAAGGVAPLNVEISNITDSSFTVSWTTDKDAIGQVNWGTDTQLGQTARQENSVVKKVHSVNVRGLAPNTNYYFVINSGGEEFDNNGIAWDTRTFPSIPPSTTTSVISGTILDTTGAAAPDVLVYVSVDGSTLLSTLTTSGGKWVLSLSNARVGTGANALTTTQNSKLSVTVQGGPLGTATAVSGIQNANPMPNIIIGKSYDFSNSDSPEYANPEANVSLPDTSATSRLFSDNITSNEDSTVKLDSIDEGEAIYTTKPEFFGTGDPGTEVSILVESDPINDSLTVSSSGSWKWSPPVDLEPGEHTVTLSWRDASGILQKITRSFTVLAADGEPAFESTPSASTPTPSPSSTPTPTPVPTVKPSSTPTATPLPTERVSIPSTQSGIPVAGSLTPTLLLSTMGIGLLFVGAYVSFKASK